MLKQYHFIVVCLFLCCLFTCSLLLISLYTPLITMFSHSPFFYSVALPPLLFLNYFPSIPLPLHFLQGEKALALTTMLLTYDPKDSLLLFCQLRCMLNGLIRFLDLDTQALQLYLQKVMYLQNTFIIIFKVQDV